MLTADLGDFDGDGAISNHDIDIMASEIRAGNRDARFDVNRSGNVDFQDHQFLIDAVFGTYLGDSNLDGRFESGDLVKVFTSGLYEDGIGQNASWESGDWNGDGDFDTGDLVAAFQSEGFEREARVKPRLTSISPALGEEMVNVTRETIIRFSDPVDPATINHETFSIIAGGVDVSGTIRVSSTNRFATFFYDEPLPSSTTVRVTLDGNAIRGQSGVLVDADSNGRSGGELVAEFRTLPLSRIPGTHVFGFVKDSMTGEPIVGATIRVDAFPEANVVTDENGRFELQDMPAPEFFVHIDGSTATGLPEGFTYPNVGKPFHSVPGQTVQLEMNREPFDVFLPKMSLADIQPLSSETPTDVGIGESGMADLATMFPELAPEVWDRISLTVAPGAAVDDQGNAATAATVIPVPPDRIPAPLPSFIDPQLVISIQAEGATSFDVPSTLEFPNLDDLRAGDRVPLMSFDHDAGRWKTVATAMVSDDATVIRTEPGSGVVAPGWHTIPPRKPPKCSPNNFLAAFGGIRTDNCEAYDDLFGDGPSNRDHESWRFDFGSATSPLEDDFERIDSGTLYSKQRGFGWLPGGRLNAIDRGTGELSSLHRDFIETQDATFVVDVDPGVYEIQIAFGDSELRRVGAGAIIEDRLRTNITTDANEFHTTTLLAASRDGQMTIQLGRLEGGTTAAITSIAIDHLTRNLDTNANPTPLTGQRFFALENTDSDFVIRGSVASMELFAEEVLLAPNTTYRLHLFNPMTLNAGFAEFSTGSLQEPDSQIPDVILYSSRIDQDGDGLSDDGEFVLGTSLANPDTDADGITDLAEIQQNLDPLDDRGFPTGVIASLPSSGFARTVDVVSDSDDFSQLTAYVATSTGLTIADVSQFNTPIVVSELNLAGGAVDVAVDPIRKIAILARGSSHTRLDISDPVRPVVLEESNLDAQLVQVIDGTGYLASGSSLISIDLRTGRQLEELPLADNIAKLELSGNKLFLLTGNALQIVETFGDEFIPRGRIDLPSPVDLTIANDIAYVTGGSRGGYMTIDVTDSESPSIISLSDVVAPFQAPKTALAVNGSGLGLLVGNNRRPGQVDVMNVSDLMATNEFLTTFDLGDAPQAVSIAGGIGFVANGNAGLTIVNYLSFDAQGQPPVAQLNLEANDVTPGTPEVELQEESALVLSPDVSDDVQVYSVDLMVNGESVFRDISPPFDLPFSVPATDGEDSQYTIEVRAQDTGGNTSMSPATIVRVIPDTFSPELIQLKPRNGQVLGGGTQLVTLGFSERIDLENLNGDSVRVLNEEGLEIPFNEFESRLGGRILQFTFDFLTFGDYEIVIDAPRIFDRAGNALGQDEIRSQFTITEGTIFWTAREDGFWDDPQNWDLERLPNADDIVRIDVPEEVTVTVRSSTVVDSLHSDEHLVLSSGSLTLSQPSILRDGITINAGQLNVPTNVQLRGDSKFNSGIINAPGEVHNSGLLEVSSDMQKFLNGTVSNTGLLRYTGNEWRFRRTAASLDGVIENRQGGTFEIATTGDILHQTTGNNRIVNRGDVIINSSESSTLLINFNNEGGTVRGESGRLNLHGGGDSIGGHLQINDGSTLAFGSGRHVVAGNWTGGGAGAILINGGIFSVVEDTQARFAMTGSGLQMVGATISTSGLLENAGNAVFSAGVIDSAGEFRNSGVLDVAGMSQKFLNGMVSNTGLLRYTGSEWRFKRTGGSLTGVIENRQGGTFEIATTGDILHQTSAANRIANRGEVKINSSDASTILINFNNEGGTVIGQSGQLNLHGGGNSNGGRLQIGEGSTLAFSGGQHVVAGNWTGGGAGAILVDGGIFSVAEDTQARFAMTDSGLQMVGGTISTSGLLENVGNAVFSAGVIDSAGEFHNAGNLEVASTSQKFLNGTLSNTGFIRYTGDEWRFKRTGGSLDGVVENRQGGTFEIATTGDILHQTTGANRIVNRGEVRINSDDASTIGINFNNEDGAVLGKTGRLNLNGGGVSHGGHLQMDAESTLAFSGGQHIASGSWTGGGAGAILMSGGTFSVAEDTEVSFALTDSTLQMTGATVNPIGVFENAGNATFSAGMINSLGEFRNTGILEVSSTSQKFLNGTLSNLGRLRYTGDEWRFKRTGGSLPGVVENQQGGTFEIATTGSILDQSSGANRIVNRGEVRINSSDTSTMRVQFNNEGGRILGETGRLNLQGGGFSRGGDLRINEGSTLAFNGGSHDVSGIWTGGGSGVILVSDGTFGVADDAEANFSIEEAGLQLAGGTVNANGLLEVSGNTIFATGIINAPGEFRNTGTLEVAATSQKFLNGTLSNSGVLRYTGDNWRFKRTGTSLPGVVENLADGVFEIATMGIIQPQSSGDNRIVNQGTIVVDSQGAATIAIELQNNGGSIEVEAGTLQISGSLESSGLLRVAAGAILNVTGSLTQTESGTIEIVVAGPATDEFGRILVGQQISLAGSLRLVTLDPLDLDADETLSLITFGSVVGEFENIDIGALVADLVIGERALQLIGT